MFTAGPPIDEGANVEHVERVISAYERYLQHVDADFKQHFEHRIPHTETEADGADGAIATDTPPPVLIVGGDDRSMGSNRPPHHAFFVVAFVPDVILDGLEISYTQPLLSVFGSFGTEAQAEEYAYRISQRYPRLEPCVV